LIEIIICVAVGIVGITLGIVIGILIRRSIAEKKLGVAEERAKKIEADAKVQAEADTNKMILAAQKEINQMRTESEREIKERRSEISRSERRLTQKEESLDKKTEQLEKKNEQLDKRIKDNEIVREQLNASLELQTKALERISGLTAEEAKRELIEKLESVAKFEFAQRMDELEEQFKDEADTKARNYISLAIQRYAADNVSEATITSVSLPGEEMKGRIIGREGRNILMLEKLTGVDLIIDDTPEAITLSGFDPVRREIARLSLEKLIADGRIHPARIEEMVEKATREVEATVKQAGERATFEVGIHGINPELVKLLGRLRYRTSYGQNVLKHSIEVAFISGMIADELGVDSLTAKRAGLLHDIGKAFPHDVEGSHVQIGVNAAKKFKESREVVHAIEAHHNDVDPKTIIAIIVQAADAISAARPGARREDLENYIKRLEKLEEIAKSFEGVDKAFAIQAGRELRVMVKPEDVTDESMKLIARDMAK
jgi:ribonuclease Y